MWLTLFWIFAAIAALLAFAIFTGWRLRQRSFEMPAPAWTPFFSFEQNTRFLECLRESLASMNAQGTIGNGVISLISGQSARQIPLMIFAEACRDHDESQWPSILQAKLTEALADFGTVDLTDFGRMKDLLRLQLGVPTGLPDVATIGREDLPGIRTILVIDSASRVRTIHPAEAVTWHRPVEELFQIAIDHMRGLPPPPIEQIELTDRLTAFAITGESPFVATQILSLDENPKLCGPGGAIVAAPTQHILLAHPITSSASQDALFPLGWIAMRRWRDGPDSISPRLYWYTNGRFVHLPYELNGEKFSLQPPAEFAAMLATLRAGRR